MPLSLYHKLRAYRESIGAPWFTKAFDLNLLIARSNNVGEWDDVLYVAFRDDAGRECVEAFTCTGDAWGGEWTNPTHPDGCIYTLDQHVRGGFQRGTFKDRPALRQVKDFAFVRWKGDHVPTVDELEALPSQLAIRGTHIHNRAGNRTPVKPATDDSEGCTVLLYQHQHAALIELVRQQHARHSTATVSPTFCRLDAVLQRGDYTVGQRKEP